MKWHTIDSPQGAARVATAKTPKGVWVSYRGRSFFIHNGAATAGAIQGDDQIVAPMTGKIIEVSVEEGSSVKAGQVVVTMEAMKMEYRIEAPRDGIVEKVLIGAEELIDQGTLLVQLNEASDD